MEEIIEVSKKIQMLLHDSENELEYFTSFHEDICENKGLLKGMQLTLQRNIDALEKEIQGDLSSEEGCFTPKEKEIVSQVERAKKQKENLVVDLQKSMADLKINNEELEKLTANRENICENNSAKLGKLKYDIDLYTNITGIRWQYDCDQDEVRGYICKRGVLKPFSLSTKKHSLFFIANYLWDLMEQS